MTCPVPGGNEERASPRDSLDFTVGGRPAALCYGRPSSDGRRIFGGLVPYGDLWRTGANEPTVLRLPFAASVAGIRVRRGRYALYTVPDADHWTIVLNRSVGQSGRTRTETGERGNVFPSAYTDDVRREEVGRAPVEIESIPYTRRLTARAEIEAPDRTIVLLEWETTRVRIPVER